LVRDVLGGFEAGGAESVYGGGGGCVWEAGCKGGSPELIRCFAVGDLRMKALADVVGRFGEAYIATADILDEFGVDFRLLDHLLEQCIDEIVELSIFNSALEAFRKRCSNGESNDYIIGILRCADIELA
jgi:hypothetical protein